ncbi:peptidylprolyl isomerase [uncultured Erythrobacter sp.]|uniref:peptidylprolyl isomerase n=1 Tax=uncultured Erythrobacter sp. TaxID=263913 RepID=UPI00260A2F69|nr:peptidylprolyl isomerase [uncultured Erythrobacter sp.]
MNLPNWTREPLVHFLGLGALVYVALTWGGEPVDPASRVIDVGPEEQAQISLNFERIMGRAPTDAELDAAIDKYVRDEVLYREALRLGLDQGDAVVRQRMVSKMDMSATVAVETAEPDEATLRAFYDENAERYVGAVRVSFEQAFYADRGAAQSALGGAIEGEAISLPGMVNNESMREITTVFGEGFARGLETLEPGEEWQGPLPSGFGWHLVRLTARSTDPADFSSVRERVENDWRSAEIEAREAQAFDILRSAYRIEIDR